MPELPEVQTVVGDLNKKIKDYEVVSFWTEWRKGVKTPLRRFKKEIIGCKIKKIKRRGKNILMFLDCGSVYEKVILIHLKMTGHLLVKGGNKKSKKNNHFNDRVNQYIHHIWTLEKGGVKKTLEFSDLRKFGKIKLINAKNIINDSDLNKLGVEPLSQFFTEEKLRQILEKRKKSIIRNVLLDQGLIVGIGNIYVSEILFESRVMSTRLAGELKDEEIKMVYRNIKKVLQKAVKLRGTSDSDYRDTAGETGGFQKVLKVYNRERKNCKRKNCGGIIKREKINQRSAYFCDKCQK